MLQDAPALLRFVTRKEDDDGMQIGAGEVADPMFGGIDAVVAEYRGPAAMPSLNSSGKEASGASSSPSARRPFQVKATVTQRLSWSMPARIDDTERIVSLIADTQARPPAPSRNDRNSYRAVSAGARVSRKCWMSSNSTMRRRSLHLVEHG